MQEGNNKEGVNMKIGIIFHWTAGTYMPNFIDNADYHGVIGYNGKRVFYKKNFDYTDNIPQHTWHRNTNYVGIAICGMRDASHSNFGKYPLREDQIEEMIKIAAEICILKSFIPTKCMTHGEAALLDGYGVYSGDPKTRWDLGVLQPGEISGIIVRETGSKLRKRIIAYMQKIIKGEVKLRKELHGLK